MDQYSDTLVDDRKAYGREANTGSAGSAPRARTLADRLNDRICRAQQIEAQGRQEAEDLKTALALLRSQPAISEILDAIVKTGII